MNQKTLPTNPVLMALLTGIPVGLLAGLIGLGGGEFRLPILVLLFGLVAKAAVPLNLVISLITLVGALAIRSATLSIAPVMDLSHAVLGLSIGGLVGAFLAPGLLKHLSDDRFGQVLAGLLMLIGIILLVEAFVPVLPLGLLDPRGVEGLLAGVALGLMIGVVAALLRVAGGEFLIPTFIIVYGASTADAGTASLVISIVAVIAGLIRYRRLRMLPDRPSMRGIGWPMGLGSILGAVLGGMLVPYTSEPVLKLILGLVLVAAAIKTLYDHRG
ncbi:MAG: sulfite exporter TauE/SafE family protein [Pseudomonadota bacterium]|nr:sulfite exporter TauE/SafE family protein [Pseudomonadota bacterium]